MEFSSLQKIAYLPQYCILVIAFSYLAVYGKIIFNSERIKLVLLLFILNLISLINGYLGGYDVNYKGFILTLIFIISAFSNVVIKFPKIAKLYIIIIFFEYLLGYFFEMHLRRVFYGINIIRPMGIFIDLHFTAILGVIFLYLVLRKTWLSGIFAFFTGNITSVLTFFTIIFFENFKLNLKYLYLSIISILFIIILLSNFGYFLSNDHNLVNIVNEIFSFKLIAHLDISCVLLGCSVDIGTIQDFDDYVIGNFKILHDIGYLRICYQYGFIWAFLIFLYWIGLNFVIGLALLVSAFHYPIVFGALPLFLFTQILRGHRSGQ